MSQLINDRISDVIQFLELNPASFAEAVEVKGPVIYNIIKGRRSKPTYDLLQKILLKYPKINATWLLKGEGSLIQTEYLECDFYIDPGNSSVDDLFELFQSLSELNKQLGGEGLLFKNSDKLASLMSNA